MAWSGTRVGVLGGAARDDAAVGPPDRTWNEAKGLIYCFCAEPVETTAQLDRAGFFRAKCSKIQELRSKTGALKTNRFSAA